MMKKEYFSRTELRENLSQTLYLAFPRRHTDTVEGALWYAYICGIISEKEYNWLWEAYYAILDDDLLDSD